MEWTALFPQPGHRVLRGNLHTHSLRSDGTQEVPQVIKEYSERGYDFLALTDHDFFASATDLAGFSAHDLILLPGNEVTQNGPHIVQIGGSTAAAPFSDRELVLQNLRHDHALAIMAHPNWRANFDHTPYENLLEWKDLYCAMEIFNGSGVLNDTGSAYAVEKWDRLLSAGAKIWAVASDDSHYPEHMGLGWISLSAKEKTAAAILAALSAGSFYSSTGVIVQSLQQKGRLLRIETTNADKIAAFCQHGKRFAQSDDRAMEILAPPDARFVRFQCWGRGESLAWTQPVFFE